MCCSDVTNPTLTCCNVFGNVGGDYVECIAEQDTMNSNISLDPLFCDAANGDFRLQDDSPCAPFSPPNPDCDLIGAWGVGCEPTLTRACCFTDGSCELLMEGGCGAAGGA